MTTTDPTTIDERLLRWVDDCGTSMAVPVEADKVLAQLEEHDPDALREWLWDQRHRIIVGRLADILRRRRREARTRSSVERTDSLLTVTYVVDGTYRALGTLTYTQLGRAAESYDALVRTNRMEAAYLRAVQKRLPDDDSQTVADVFDDTTLNTLRTQAA